MSLLNSLQRNFLNSYATIVFAFAICHLPIRFSELANTPHSPQANALTGQWQMANADFGMNWQSGCTEITMKNTGSERRENLGQSVFGKG